MKKSVIISGTESRVAAELGAKLQGHNFEVFRANTVEEALRQLESRPTELFLVDLDEPVPNGWAAVPRITQLYPALRVMGLTERSDMAEFASRARLRGIAEKPLDYQKLLPVIETMAGRRRGWPGFWYVPARSARPAEKISVYALEHKPCPAAYSGWGINE